ncbi:MAG TPA: glutamine--fructose-6-phosphate aminotransferase, partial [Bacteroidota bacterium]
MCGIIGYIGQKETLPIILDGLKHLEYRGYDSAGIALLNEGKLVIRKKAGKVADLEALWKANGVSANIGIGHTRWATHGEPNDVNAHPHLDCKGEIAVIHNGVIENYAAIKKVLLASGHTFTSATDTEVLTHFIEEFYKKTGNLEQAVRLALSEVKGAYGIVVLSTHEPDRFIVARNGSPLVIGYGDGENLVASDASALVKHTRKVTYLEDGEVAIVTRDSVITKTLDDIEIPKSVEEITFELEQIERG